MLKEKWINYAVSIIYSIRRGSESIRAIAEDRNIPQAYTAKIVAVLRKNKIVDEHYKLLMKPCDISIKSILCMGHDFEGMREGPASRLLELILLAVQDKTVDQIW